MEEHHRRLHVKAERASVIGGDIVDGAFGSWALRAARSEHQLKHQSNEDLAQNARISVLLGEMRPRMSAMPPSGHQQHQQLYHHRRKANTTNIVDVFSQIPAAKNAIYGSWQDRSQSSRLYGSQFVNSSSTLPKYDQLYCNTAPSNSNGSTNTIATTGIRREPPEYGKVGRSVSSWQVTNSEHRPTNQAGWLKSSRPLARGALSPAAYFRDLEHRNGSGASSPIVGGLSVVAVPITGRILPIVEIENTAPNTSSNVANEIQTVEESTGTLSRNTPRQASFMAAMQRQPLNENNSSDSNREETNNQGNEMKSDPLPQQPLVSTDSEKTEDTVTRELVETPIRRPRGRDGSMRYRQSSRSMGRLDFEKLRLGISQVADVEIDENGSSSSSRKNSRDDCISSSSPTTAPAPVFSTPSTSSASFSGDAGSSKSVAPAVATTSRQTSSNSSVDSNHNEAMKMIRRARPKSYVLATSASMNDGVLSSSMIANEQSSSISHETTTSGRELPSSLMGSTTSMEMRSGGATSSAATSNSGQQTSRSLNAPHPPATHRLQRFIALFNSSKMSDGAGDPKKSRMKRSRTSLPASRVSLPGTTLQRDGIARQTWVKHQEIALGKSGKRNHWEDRWAVLCRRSLYLCIESPAYTSEKTVELSAHTRVDVCNAIVDIAYDWLSSSFSKQRHVVRIVTQNRSEHLIELNTESEMLSWISVLQSSSEDSVLTGGGDENESGTDNNNHTRGSSNSAALHNSQSIASLASSSCSTATTSEFLNSHQQHPLQQQQSNLQNQQKEQKNQQTVNELSTGVASHLPTSKSFGGLSTTASSTTENAKNRLIMHRYIAKNSQLQSPTSNKKMDVDSSTVPSGSSCAATSSSLHHQAGPGPSRDAENGESTAMATTPKSGRKWKKSKAAKQGSGGGSSGSSSGSQQQGTAGAPQPVLGIRLADCPTGSCEDHVPMLVQICVCVVETYGMDTVGIYRIPGNTAAVNALKESLSSRGFDSVDLSKVESLDPRWRDVNVVSSLLKMFLRKLPEPLLTDKLYPFFIDANRISTHHNRLHKLRNLLRKLPRPHYDTLRFLIVHLSEITKHSDINKMECRNLALMFGPSIVRPSDDNMATMVTHMSDQCKIIETLIHYNIWMFDETSTTEDAVPEQHPADGQNPLEPGSYGVGVPTGVSAASFNDMHNLIRKANEDQAAAMMNEGKGQKIKNMLRRNSRRDKSKSKLKIESTAPAAVNPRGWTQPTASNTSAASVESAFCGNYQERDIDAEIESRQTVSPQMTSGSADGASSTRLDQSPSLESSLGSLPDTSRTEPILGSTGYGIDDEEAKEAARRKRQEEMYSARRIFIAGAAGAAAAATTSADAEKAAIDALANHSQHLHLASSPAFEVLSEETREKIRRMQKKQSWHDTKELKNAGDLLKAYSPTKDLTDALSCTSDYSTTSSAPLSTNPPLNVACVDQPNSSSDYASSDPSPCARNPSTSPASRPSNLAISPSQLQTSSSQTQPQQAPMSRSQKIRLRTKLGSRDPSRRHTLSDVDTLKEGRLDKLARWFGIRKSSPDVSRDEGSDDNKNHRDSSSAVLPPPLPSAAPPVIVRTSPNELTPVSGDEQL